MTKPQVLIRVWCFRRSAFLREYELRWSPEIPSTQVANGQTHEAGAEWKVTRAYVQSDSSSKPVMQSSAVANKIRADDTLAGD